MYIYFLGKYNFDPYDMDREEFNPDMCMLRYSQECSLSNILMRKGHIDNEIKVINSDLQNLLYNNYQKVDKVTSVIAKMKTDFVEMEQKMDDLYDKMNGISRTSSRILEKLQPVENKMSRLLKTQDNIKKLSLLTDLVPTIKMHVGSGMFSVAARCYLKAEKLLKKYGHLSSLGGIVEECSELVIEIKTGLRNKLNCEIYERKELTDTLYMLLALQEPSETLLNIFLNSGDKYLANLLISMNKILADSLEANRDHFLNKANTYINSCCNYIEKMSIVLEVSNRVFQSQRDLKIGYLNTLLEEFFLKNMDKIRTKLLHYMEENFQMMNEDLLPQLLDKFIRQCHKSGAIKTEIIFYNQGLSIVLQICVRRCEIYLETMKKDFDMQLIKQAGELSPQTNISHSVLFLIEWTEQKLMAVLLSVVPYIRPEYRCCREVMFRKVFCKVIVREDTFIVFLKYIIKQSWLFLTKTNVKCFSKPLLCAFLAKFLLEFNNVVPEFLLKVDGYLSSTSENLLLTSTDAVTTEFKSMALKIVDLYIQIRCQNMTHMIQKSMENRDWMASKEPTRPRAVIKMVLNDLMESKREIEKIFGVCPDPVKKRGSDIGSAILCELYSTDSKSKESIIEKKVLFNKIFLECSASLNKIELNTPSIVKALLKNILTSFIQLIRLKTLNQFSLQQIQVDVCYLQCYLSELIDLDPMVQALFDEIMASACNRTVNPEMMSSHVVSVICNGNL